MKQKKEIFKKSRDKSDKIFDNSYNSGTIDFEQFSEIQILSEYEKNQLAPYYEAQDYYRTEKLIINIDSIWKRTEWYKSFGQVKKIPKHVLSEIFTYITLNIEDKTYTNCELFVGIADFLDVMYKILYEMIPPVYKIKILKEIDEKYKILDKNDTISLF